MRFGCRRGVHWADLSSEEQRGKEKCKTRGTTRAQMCSSSGTLLMTNRRSGDGGNSRGLPVIALFILLLLPGSASEPGRK